MYVDVSFVLYIYLYTYRFINYSFVYLRTYCEHPEHLLCCEQLKMIDAASIRKIGSSDRATTRRSSGTKEYLLGGSRTK